MAKFTKNDPKFYSHVWCAQDLTTTRHPSISCLLKFFLFATVSNTQPHCLFFFCPTLALSVELSALALRALATLDAVEQAATLFGDLVDVPDDAAPLFDVLFFRNLEE